MPTGYIVPDGEVQNEWYGIYGPHSFDWQTVAEDRGSPDTSDCIFCEYTGAGSSSMEEFTFDDLTGVAEVNRIDVYYYTKKVNGGGFFNYLYDGSTWLTGAYPILPSTSYSWNSESFTGLSLTQDNLTGVKIRMLSLVPKDSGIWIACMYGMVYYTEVGWSHKWLGFTPTKFLGMELTSESKILGVG